MHKKQTTRLLAMVLSIMMILSLVVVPAGAARPMGGADVAETPVGASTEAPKSGRGTARLSADKTGSIGDSWTFTGAEYNQAMDGYNTSSQSYEGLTLTSCSSESADATATNKNHVVVGNGGKIAVPVAGQCNVKVSFTWAAAATLGVGDNTVEIAMAGGQDPTKGTNPLVYAYSPETAGTVELTSAGSTYVTQIEIVDYEAPAPAISVDPETATVTMANGETEAVTAEVAIEYANIAATDMSTVTAVAMDTDVVTCAVSAEKDKVTLTPGTKAGETTVTVTATPSDTGVAALTATITVTCEDPSAGPTTVVVGPHKWADTVVNADDNATKYKPNDVGVTFDGNWDFSNSHGPKSGAATDTITVDLAAASNVTIELCQYSNSNKPGEASVVLTGGSAPVMAPTGDGAFRSGEKGSSYTATFLNVPAGEAVFTFGAGIYAHGITVSNVVAEGTYKWVDTKNEDNTYGPAAGSGITFAPDGGKWGFSNSHGPFTANEDGTFTMTLSLAGPANVMVELCGYSNDNTEDKSHISLGDIVPVAGTATMKPGDSPKAWDFMNVPGGDAVFTISKNTYVHGVSVTYVVPEGGHKYADTPNAQNTYEPATAGVTCKGNWDFSNGHGPKTGAADQTMELALGGKANVTIETCGFGAAASATVKLTGAATEIEGVAVEEGKCFKFDNANGLLWKFKNVPAGVAEFVLSSNTYVHGITVEYVKQEEPEELGNGKVDVWDFGAATLDEARFNNMITPEVLKNSEWGGLGAGAFGNAELNGLTWFGGGSTNHRLYTTNEAVKTAMAFVDEEGAEKNGVYGAEGMSDGKGEDPYFKDTAGYDKETAYTGYVYSNNNAAGKELDSGTVVYIALDLNAGDKVSVVASTNGGDSTISFAGPSGLEATQIQDSHSRKVGQVKTFYAKEDGQYKIYSADEKLVVARVYREHPTQLVVSGTVTLPEGATPPAGMAMTFTNNKSGAVKEAEVKEGDAAGTYTYRAVLVAPYDYKVATKNGKGLIVEEGGVLDLQVPSEGDAVTHDVKLTQVPLVSISGTITGPDAEYVKVHKPVVTMTPGPDYLYVPEVTVDGTSYSFEAQQDVEYTVGVTMINDYSGPAATKVTYSAGKTDDTIVMTKKPVYAVTVTASPSEVDLTNAKLTFVNLKEAGKGDETQTIAPYDAALAGKGAYPYTYNYTGTTGIELRDGQYEVLVAGVGAPEQAATANLVVNGAAASIEVPFDTEIPSVWNFADADFDETDLPVARGGDGNYKGLILEGNIQKNKTYCLMGNAVTNQSTGEVTLAAAKVKIPVKAAGNVVAIEICYSGSGTLGDVEFAANECSGSTGKFETFSYTATEADATAGYVELNIAEVAGATDAKGPQIYLTKITATSETYKDTITVGADKDYQTINAALAAVEKMARTPDQRVTIVIDPGNYEEHVIVNANNVTFKNAKADAAELKLANKGVDIGENEVRITHYYGTGYDYYSMKPGTFQWDEETLAAGKANGYAATSNKGDGKYNGYGYWCAATLIKGSGFEAEGIIFENSFNQYISAKSLEDVIVPNGKVKEDKSAPRASLKTAGDTAVQKKAYVERAAALAITDTADKAYFNHCAFISRQDTLYGDPVRAAFYDCDIYGGTDYIFGPMTAVFAQCDLVLNTSETNTDVAYIVAPQQDASARGYLMWNCNVVSTTPGENTASKLASKPGQLGRPWSTTSECVFYATNIGSTLTTVKGEDKEATEGTTPVSLIDGKGWLAGLSAGSQRCVEYDTIEAYKEFDNSANRDKKVSGGVLAEAQTADGKDITDYKTWMTDWNPLPEDLTVVRQPQKTLDPNAVDKTELNAAIEAAEDIDLTGIAVSEDGKDVPTTGKWIDKAVKDAFDEALADAKEVTADEDATKAQVDAATAALTKAAKALADAVANAKPGTKPTGVAGLVIDIAAAKKLAEETNVSEDGTDVKKTEMWVTQAVMDTFEAAIKAAEDGNVDGISDADADALAATLAEAVAAFKEASKPGTKKSSFSGGGSSKPTVPTTEKKTNDKGDVATITTQPNGDKTITVVNKDGETVAEIKLPATIPAAKTKFKDVPDDFWAAKEINDMAGLGMVKGVNEQGDLFDTDSSMTRASVATMFFRLANGKSGLDNAFADMEGHWAADAVAWAAKTGVVNGYDAERFGPDDVITRQQLAVMLCRFANLVGMDTKAHTSALDIFTDADQAADWAVDSLAWCVKNGVMKGRGDGTLDPQTDITRTEATVMFDRVIGLMK